jgi:NADPH:quinone reductase-like Zn-dependent oxidoreductase
MGFLISRLGHEVAVVRRDEDVSEVAASVGADVVVLDGSDSLAEMTRAVAAIERLAPHAKVIVVADAAAGNYHFRVVPKWSPFDHLGLEIEAVAAGADQAVVAHRR